MLFVATTKQHHCNHQPTPLLGFGFAVWHTMFRSVVNVPTPSQAPSTRHRPYIQPLSSSFHLQWRCTSPDRARCTLLLLTSGVATCRTSSPDRDTIQALFSITFFVILFRPCSLSPSLWYYSGPIQYHLDRDTIQILSSIILVANLFRTCSVSPWLWYYSGPLQFNFGCSEWAETWLPHGE